MSLEIELWSSGLGESRLNRTAISPWALHPVFFTATLPGVQILEQETIKNKGIFWHDISRLLCTLSASCSFYKIGKKVFKKLKQCSFIVFNMQPNMTAASHK